MYCEGINRLRVENISFIFCIRRMMPEIAFLFTKIPDIKLRYTAYIKRGFNCYLNKLVVTIKLNLVIYLMTWRKK